MRKGFAGIAVRFAWVVGVQVRVLPGVVAAVCAVAGAVILWGVGWALLVAAGLLLVVDSRLP